MKIFDTFLFYNELELLELRLNILDEVVDHFVIIEARVTFSGKPKPLYFAENRGQFKKFEGKIIHYVVDADYDATSLRPFNYFTDRERSIAHKHNGSPVSRLHPSIQREVHQRDSIVIPLLNVARPEDIIMLSDVDEIPDPQIVKDLVTGFDRRKIYHFNQRWFIYWLNNLCDREWFGTRAFSFDQLVNRSVDQMRYHTENRTALEGEVLERAGWHFSYLGGADSVKLKLDSLAYQGKRATLTKLLNRVFPGRLERLLRENKDVLLQGKKLKVVEIDNSFPEYLRVNIAKYDRFVKNDHN